MTITKTALAAAILAVMAVSAQAQQGPTRQIQILPAPGLVAQAPAIAANQAPANVEGEAQNTDAPAAEAAPGPDAAPQIAAPRFAPKFAPKKVIIEAQVEVKPEPKFVEPKFVPVRKVSYGHGGYGKRHCH